MSPPEAARIVQWEVIGGHIRRKKDLSITCLPNCPAPLNLMDVTSCFSEFSDILYMVVGCFITIISSLFLYLDSFPVVMVINE